MEEEGGKMSKKRQNILESIEGWAEFCAQPQEGEGEIPLREITDAELKEALSETEEVRFEGSLSATFGWFDCTMHVPTGLTPKQRADFISGVLSASVIKACKRLPDGAGDIQFSHNLKTSAKPVAVAAAK